MGVPRLNPQAALGLVGTGDFRPPVPPGAFWYTPKEVARLRRVRVSKVMGWIRRGELEAINHADGRMGRPRWKISREALELFDRARSSRNMVRLPIARRRKGGLSRSASRSTPAGLTSGASPSLSRPSSPYASWPL